MIMIPLPFLFAGLAVLALAMEWRNNTKPNQWFIWFMIAIAFQEVLIGVRFGYNQDWLKQIQPITAAILPPLAYLSFRKPRFSPHVFLHSFPIIAVFIILQFQINLIDTFLAANNLFYALALMKIGIGGTDALGWVKLNNARFTLQILWFVFALLILSGITDAIISYDYWTNQGSNTSYIASWASIIGIFTAAIILSFVMFWKKNSDNDRNQTLNNQQQVFEKLTLLLRQNPLFLDPDINLNRIAKRLQLPARDVSRAINSQTNQNVSQYINTLRVAHACKMLQETDLQITQIIYASGFNTKSNFNREFLRVTKKPPSQWRADMITKS